MKHKRFSQHLNQEAASAPQPTETAALSRNETDFVPSPDEVARRAYFSYVNQGSLPGHDVQHWLEAEAHLLAERNLTRVHAFYKRHEANHASAHAGSAHGAQLTGLEEAKNQGREDPAAEANDPSAK